MNSRLEPLADDLNQNLWWLTLYMGIILIVPGDSNVQPGLRTPDLLSYGKKSF